MLHSNSSPPLQSLLQRNSSPLKQQSLSMNGANSDSYFIFDELSTALPERNGGSKILGNNSNNFSNKSSSVGSSIGGSTNTSTATNLSSSTFQRPQYNQQQQRFGFGELLFLKTSLAIPHTLLTPSSFGGTRKVSLKAHKKSRRS